MGVLLMLMTIAGSILAGILLVASFIAKKGWLAKFTLGGVAIWLILYAVMLLGFSAASKDRVLGLNQPKEFCGFYLDCHMHAEVTSVRTAKQIGDRAAANGTFYIVGIRVFSDAKNPNITLRLLEPRALIEVNDTTAISRDLEAEALLPTADVNLGGDIKGRQTIDKEIVFDVPPTLSDPRLQIAEGYGIDSAIEAVLIDDEDSIRHARTYFALVPQGNTAGVK
jgi:hypothetical protein